MSGWTPQVDEAAPPLLALPIHVTNCADDKVRLVKWNVFRTLVREQLLGIGRQFEPRGLLARDRLLVFLLRRIHRTRRIKGVHAVFAR